MTPNIRYQILYPKDEADALFTSLSQTQWSRHIIKMYGKEIPAPRFFAWMGEVPSKGLYGKPIIAVAWTATVLAIKEKVEAEVGVNFDSCNINYYRDGNDHLGWHLDPEDEGLWTFPIAGISLGAARSFHMRKYSLSGRKKETGGSEIHERMLEHGSLLVMPAQFQAGWLHRLPKLPKSKEVGPRINLTFRRVKP